MPLRKSGTTDAVYLQLLTSTLECVRTTHSSIDLLIFNNGADVLQRDQFKADLNVTREGLAARDQIVCRFAIDNAIPICVLLSGGYGPGSSKAMADSMVEVVRVLSQCTKRN